MNPGGEEKLTSRILVVDDEAVLRMLIEDTLESEGYLVETAEDGQQAMDRLMGHDALVDLVIIDYMMPVMTGIEVVKGIKEQQEKPPLFLLLTAKPDEEEAGKRYFDLGVDEFMAKPFKPSELVKRVRGML